MPSHPSEPSSNVPSSVICPEIPAEIIAPSVSVLKLNPYLFYKIYHVVLVSVWEIFEKNDFILLTYLCISPSSSPVILPLTFILVTCMSKTLYPNPYNQMSFGIQNFQHLEWYWRSCTTSYRIFLADSGVGGTSKLNTSQFLQ